MHFIDDRKVFDYVNIWNDFQKMGVPELLIVLKKKIYTQVRNLHSGWKMAKQTGFGGLQISVDSWWLFFLLEVKVNPVQFIPIFFDYLPED